MYQIGQRIEYQNGQRADVVALPEGGDGGGAYFVIQTAEGFALCWRDLTAEMDEEVWCFVHEADPFRATLAEAEAEHRAEIVRLMGDSFAFRIRDVFTAEQFAEVQRRNVAHVDDGICATHDFYDANEFMADAFEEIMGRPLLPEEDREPTEADCVLWGDAWNHAKREHLTGPRVWSVEADTRHFNFRAVAMSEGDAREALERGLKAHAAQYDLAADWAAETLAGALVRPMTVGAAYRDDSEIARA